MYQFICDLCEAISDLCAEEIEVRNLKSQRNLNIEKSVFSRLSSSYERPYENYATHILGFVYSILSTIYIYKSICELLYDLMLCFQCVLAPSKIPEHTMTLQNDISTMFLQIANAVTSVFAFITRSFSSVSGYQDYSSSAPEFDNTEQSSHTSFFAQNSMPSNAPEFVDSTLDDACESTYTF